MSALPYTYGVIFVSTTRKGNNCQHLCWYLCVDTSSVIYDFFELNNIQHSILYNPEEKTLIFTFITNKPKQNVC